MPIPTPTEQVTFLVKIQRVLGEGAFVSSYKFALLLALADLSVELGDDTGAPLFVKLDALAEKFVGYYWRQTLPYPRVTLAAPLGAAPTPLAAPTAASASAAPLSTVLLQNTDKQAAIIQRVAEVHQRFQGDLVAAKADTGTWRGLIRDVAKTIKEMPLWRLQLAGDDFLYPQTLVANSIELKPGVAFCFRQFRVLVGDMVRGAWVRYIRRVKANQALLGQAKDLDEFLFGSERADLSAFRPLLLEVQRGDCFYCERTLASPGEVDHFIPWARYSVDLGHNFVLAHDKCNNAKSDRLGAVEHLERWCRRNGDHGVQLGRGFDGRGLVHDLGVSRSVTRWAYEQAEAAGGHMWVEGKRLVPLASGWRELPGMAT